MSYTTKLKPQKKINTKERRSEKFRLQVGQELISTNQKSCQKFLVLILKPYQEKWERREIKQRENSRFYRKNQMKSCNVCSMEKSFEKNVCFNRFSMMYTILIYQEIIFLLQLQKANQLMSPTNNQSEMPPQQQWSDQAMNAQQLQHQNQILLTFMNYERLMKQSSPGAQLYQQPKRVKEIKYYQLLQEKKREKFQIAVKANQQFLNEIVNFCEGQQRLKSIQDGPVTFSNFSKVKTTVKQFYREWCDEGSEAKDCLMIVNKAKQYLNKGDKVLAPGSGLGRLVLEFVAAGFGCQGNEVSYFMLYGSNFILNCSEQQKSFTIYPFISSNDYYYNEQDIFRCVSIPDKVASKVVAEDADFSMAGGQFTHVYNEMPQQFHCVATCFFIDTANNVFDYIDVIHKTLKSNGIWINYGPLLFHYRQNYKQVSIEVSWQVLRKYISQKFAFLQESMHETTYDHDQKSSMGINFNCLMFVCRKK